MLELATLGAGVLHNRSVELAKKFGVQLVVRSSLNFSEGTIVKEDTGMEKMLVSGVAADTDSARVAVVGLEDTPGVAFKLFNLLAKNDINIDMILQSVGRHGTKDITFSTERLCRTPAPSVASSSISSYVIVSSLRAVFTLRWICCIYSIHICVYLTRISVKCRCKCNSCCI